MKDLDSLLVFARVAEHGSFSAAAAELGQSKSAVSKQIARLEDRLGARLLHRTTRRLSLTEPGRALFRRAQRIADDVAEAEAAVAQHQERPTGQLRVNAPVSYGFRHVAPLMPDFLARYPGLSVELSLADQQVDLVAEGFDVGLRVTESLGDSSYIARRLTTEPALIVAAPAYFAAYGRPAHPDDLLHHDCLIYRYLTSGQRWRLRDRAGTAYDVPVSGRLSANNGDALAAAVLAGHGVALAPAFLVRDALAHGQLETALESYTAGNAHGVFAMYPEGRHVSPKVRAFVDFLAERLGGAAA